MNLSASEAVIELPKTEVSDRPMSICICGWYFNESFLKTVAASGYSAFVVKHREGDTQGIPSALYENRGLEFGAYRDYILNHWDGESDVLFMHDDTEIIDPQALYHVTSLRGGSIDHAYIFSSQYEELVNGGAHGRAMWMSRDLIIAIKDSFPVDEENHGENIGPRAQKGIVDFHKRVTAESPNTGLAAIIPGFSLGHRGHLNNKVWVFKRTNTTPGNILNA